MAEGEGKGKTPPVASEEWTRKSDGAPQYGGQRRTRRRFMSAASVSSMNQAQFQSSSFINRTPNPMIPYTFLPFLQNPGNLPSSSAQGQESVSLPAALLQDPRNLPPNDDSQSQDSGSLPGNAEQSSLGYPAYYSNLQPPLDHMQQAPPSFTNCNPAALLGNMNIALSNPLAWSGMKSVRDSDIDVMLHDNWNTQLFLVGWSPHRKPVMNLENDVFIRSYTEEPWKNTGNVVFFCEGRKVVRCHGILLQCVLPDFYNELHNVANFEFNGSYRASSSGLPYIPIITTGIDERIIEHLIALIFRGIAVMTGKDVQMLLQVMEVLRMHELVVCIAPTPGNSSINPEWQSSATTAAQTSTETISSTSAPYGGQEEVKRNLVVENLESSNRHLMTTPIDRAITHPIGSRTHETFGHAPPLRSPVIKKCPALPSRSPSSASLDDDGNSKSGVENVESKQVSRPSSTTQAQESNLETAPSMSAMLLNSNIIQVTPPKVIMTLPHQPPILENLEYEVTANNTGLPAVDLDVNVKPYSIPMDAEAPTAPVLRRRQPRKPERRIGKRLQERRRQMSECKASPASDAEDEDESDKKKRKRTVYPKELRGQALDALKGGKPIRDVAQCFNVTSKLISRWKYEAKKAESDDSNVVPSVTLHEGFETTKGEMTEIVNKNSLSFDYGRPENGNMMNPFNMKLKVEPLDYYDGTGTMYPENPSNGMPLHTISVYGIEKQENGMLDDAQNENETED